MAGYDTGAFDTTTGDFRLSLFNVDDLERPLQIKNLVVTQLPRVASIDAMVHGGKLTSWQGIPIRPWSVSRAGLCGEQEKECAVNLTRDPRSVPIGSLGQGRHIVQQFDGKCLEQSPPPKPPRDSSGFPDVNNCPNAGFNLDLFPSTMVFVTATVVDPAAKHWDPATKTFIVGPVESNLFYQFAGQHPDLNRNGVDDYIDIATGVSKDANKNGVPDEVECCHKQLGELDGQELKERNLRITLADLARRGDAERIEKVAHELDETAEMVRRAKEEFRECEKHY